MLFNNIVVLLTILGDNFCLCQWNTRFDIEPITTSNGHSFQIESFFPTDTGDLTLSDEGSVQRVISILHGNIKQWGFIESQLLEPNVNLAMVNSRRSFN